MTHSKPTGWATKWEHGVFYYITTYSLSAPQSRPKSQKFWARCSTCSPCMICNHEFQMTTTLIINRINKSSPKLLSRQSYSCSHFWAILYSCKDCQCLRLITCHDHSIKSGIGHNICKKYCDKYYILNTIFAARIQKDTGSHAASLLTLLKNFQTDSHFKGSFIELNFRFKPAFQKLGEGFCFAFSALVGLKVVNLACT